MFLIFDFQTAFHGKFVGMAMTFLRTKFLTPGSCCCFTYKILP